MAGTTALGRALERVAAWTGLGERRCRVCGHIAATSVAVEAASGPALCAPCRAAVTPRAGGFCTCCGALVGDDKDEPGLCGECLAQARPWRRVMVGNAYAGQLRRMILEYKFSGRLALGAALGRMALDLWLAREHVFPPQAQGAGEHEAMLVVPVPLHTKRLIRRGFNQSLELARPLAHHLGVDADAAALVRTRDTKPQMSLSRTERAGNLKGAFRADPARVAGKTVLLVDDIFTTGATINEAALALSQAGARAVDALVLVGTLE